MDTIGTRIEVFEWKNERIGRIVSSRTSLSVSFKGKKKNVDVESNELDYILTHPNAYVDFDIPWDIRVSYNLGYNKPGLEKTITQTSSFSGNLKLTKKWKIGASSGFDFKTEKLSYTSFNIYRDLHCWEMSFNWVPFGLRQSFTFNINVKSSILKDLKLNRTKNWQDYQ
jgi:hypothetical protein